MGPGARPAHVCLLGSRRVSRDGCSRPTASTGLRPLHQAGCREYMERHGGQEPPRFDAGCAVRSCWSARVRPLGAYRRLVQIALNVWSNVETWPYPAYGSRVYTPSARPDGLKLNGDRVCAW